MLKDKNKIKEKARERRHWIIRKKVKGTKDKPRLIVHRSLKHIYAQIVDDTSPKGTNTLVSASTLELKDNNGMKKTELSYKIGAILGEKAIDKGISAVCFDRAGYKYHGRVKALAEGARKSGLKF